MVGWIKMPLNKEVGLGPGHIVLDGDPVGDPAPPTAAPPHFSAHVYCGQTVARLSSCWARVSFRTSPLLWHCWSSGRKGVGSACAAAPAPLTSDWAWSQVTTEQLSGEDWTFAPSNTSILTFTLAMCQLWNGFCYWPSAILRHYLHVKSVGCLL